MKKYGIATSASSKEPGWLQIQVGAGGGVGVHEKLS